LAIDQYNVKAAAGQPFGNECTRDARADDESIARKILVGDQRGQRRHIRPRPLRTAQIGMIGVFGMFGENGNLFLDTQRFNNGLAPSNLANAEAFVWISHGLLVEWKRSIRMTMTDMVGN
jgi:hypothetical protein